MTFKFLLMNSYFWAIQQNNSLSCLFWMKENFYNFRILPIGKMKNEKQQNNDFLISIKFSLWSLKFLSWLKKGNLLLITWWFPVQHVMIFIFMNLGLINIVENSIRIEHSIRPSRPIYLVGDSFGGCLALAVAARNPTKDLVLVLANPGRWRHAI